MKLITLTFFTFIRSVLFYLLLTLPIAVKPKIYFLAVISAFVLGVGAWAVFALFTLVIRLLKASPLTAYILLYAAVVIAVVAAYSILLAYAVSGMHFWNIEPFSLFPTAAIAAGCISVYINRKKIKRYFQPPRYLKIEGFSLYPTKYNLN